MDKNEWGALESNNSTTFNAAIQIASGLNVRDGDKRLENDKIFRAQLIGLLASVVISQCVHNQILLAQNKPLIIAPN